MMAPSRPNPQTQFVLDAMGEVATRTDQTMEAIRASLETLTSQVGSLDARMGHLDTAYQQVSTQLDLHSRAVNDHTRVMDTIERHQESLAQHMKATAEAVARLGGSKVASAMEDGEEELESARAIGKRILGSPPTPGWTGIPHPMAPAMRPLDPGTSTGVAGKFMVQGDPLGGDGAVMNGARKLVGV
jgi:uncharacterized protein YukE